MQPAQFEQAIDNGSVAEMVPRLRVKSGDSFFVPGGRLHAIGGGNLLVEIQENSDTTYRVFDWGRIDDEGQPRALHRAESMRAIDFEDYEPQLVREEGEQLLESPHFVVERWRLGGARLASEQATFAIFVCLEGAVTVRRGGGAAGGLLSRPGVRGGKRIAPVHHECEPAPRYPADSLGVQMWSPRRWRNGCGPRGWTPSIFQLPPSAVKL